MISIAIPPGIRECAKPYGESIVSAIDTVILPQPEILHYCPSLGEQE